MKPEDTMTLAYNSSVEIVSRGFMSSVTENIFTIRYDTKENKKVYHSKLCFPIEPDVRADADMTNIEWIPGCHTFSILFYGLEKMDTARKMLWEEIERLKLTPLGNEMRSESIIAPYVNMRVSPEDFVTRFAVPVKE